MANNAKSKKNGKLVPFAVNGVIPKSTNAAELAQKLDLGNGDNTVSSDLLSAEAHARISAMGKDVDPLQYFAVGEENPNKIKRPLVAPWEGLSTRKKVKAFNLFPSEAIKARLQYMKDKTGVSQHEICMEYLEKMIIKASDELFEKERRSRG